MRAFALAGLICFSLAQTAAAQRGPLDDVRWLQGCWELTRGASRVVEKWTPPDGNMMLGESRMTSNGVERESEKLRLFTRGDTLVYEATPSRQQMTEFRTTAWKGEEIVFANPAHDFPQRIVYRGWGPIPCSPGSKATATVAGTR
jgi:hypothetical protein